jgi:exodeoxyribonuclease III
MKLATWNVNSLTIRLNRVLGWLAEHEPDVLCLQELKMETHKFPHEAFAQAGYTAAAFGQKTYNGVAILAKSSSPSAPSPIVDVLTGIPGYDDPQARAMAATIDGVRVICLYVVNGQSVGSEKFEYKLQWLKHCTRFIEEEMARHEKVAVLGDFNIAPEDRDVHDPDAWRDQVLCTDDERAYFDRWLNLGLKDAFRLFEQPEKSFSWWDYRMLGFPKNLGLRIDHILLSESLANLARACTIDREARKAKGEDKPSDHAPVMAIVER